MNIDPPPTERELEILKILWRRRRATVRQVYEEMSQELPIVQNTVQAFLRTMEEKGQVRHQVEGRTFVYEPLVGREPVNRRLAEGLLQRVFDGSVDQLVESVFSAQQPSDEELARLEKLIAEAKSAAQANNIRRSK